MLSLHRTCDLIVRRPPGPATARVGWSRVCGAALRAAPRAGRHSDTNTKMPPRNEGAGSRFLPVERAAHCHKRPCTKRRAAPLGPGHHPRRSWKIDLTERTNPDREDFHDRFNTQHRRPARGAARSAAPQMRDILATPTAARVISLACRWSRIMARRTLRSHRAKRKFNHTAEPASGQWKSLQRGSHPDKTFWIPASWSMCWL